MNSVLKIANNVSGVIHVSPFIDPSRYSQCLFQVRFLQLRLLSSYAEQCIGLPGQGIDSNDGQPVGGYVVR